MLANLLAYVLYMELYNKIMCKNIKENKSIFTSFCLHYVLLSFVDFFLLTHKCHIYILVDTSKKEK